MRLVLKPGGLAILVVALLGLVYIAFLRRGGGSSSSGANAPAAAVAGGGARPSSSGGGAGGSASIANRELLTNPIMAAEDWHFINEGLAGESHIVSGPVDDSLTAAGMSKITRVRQVQVLKKTPHAWNVQVRQTAPAAIPAGTPLKVKLWARSKERCQIAIDWEKATAPYDKMANRVYTLTPEWKMYELTWTSDRAIPANWAQVSIQLSANTGTIDLAAASLRVDR